MKISAENFKGIKKISEFDIRRLNILTGANSGGKSSVIHLLLLLKQSLEAGSPIQALKINKPYVSLGRFESLLYRERDITSFSITLHFARSEFSQRTVSPSGVKRKARFQDEDLDFNSVNVKFAFKKSAERIVVDRFSVELIGGNPLNVVFKKNRSGTSYDISSTSLSSFIRFYEEDYLRVLQDDGTSLITTKVNFQSFFPSEFPELEATVGYIIRQVRMKTISFFASISYLGPLREEPKEYYFQDDDLNDQIGNKGENAASILYKYADKPIKSRWYSVDRSELESEYVEKPLGEVLNHWMCEVFGLARKVKTERAKSNRHIHEISLWNLAGNKVPIVHVGFGISQILPVLVECLRPSDRTRLVILEQPEIHLHPKVQSLLFDFLASLDQSVFILVETHSDHIINRIRRRVAESEDERLLGALNLVFVNDHEAIRRYENIELNSLGTIDYWPEGFFDQSDLELQYLLRAQSNKIRRSEQNG